MESAQVKIVYTLHSTVSEVASDTAGDWFFALDGFGSRFHVNHNVTILSQTDLRPGDRVRITITKEPDVAH